MISTISFPALGLRVVAGPAHESRLDGRESKDVLSALAVARLTKMGPSLAVERRLEPVDDRRIRGPNRPRVRRESWPCQGRS